MRSRVHALAAAAVLGLLLTCAPASADTAPPGTVTAQPNQAGRPSTISIDANGTPAGLSSGTPQGVTIAIYKGFTIDPRAVVGRCTDQQASSVSCPDDSRFGTGTVQGSASLGTFSQPFTASLDAFAANPHQAGDLADVIVEVHEASSHTAASARGRLVPVNDPTFGTELRFDPLPQGPTGVTLKIDRFTFTAGVQRTIAGGSAGAPGSVSSPGTQRRRHNRRHHRKRRHHAKRRHRRARASDVGPGTYSLFTNPTACSGSWPAQVRVRYPDHQATVDASIACTP